MLGAVCFVKRDDDWVTPGPIGFSLSQLLEKSFKGIPCSIKCKDQIDEDAWEIDIIN